MYLTSRNIIVFNVIYCFLSNSIRSDEITAPLVTIDQGVLSGFYLNTINNRQIIGFRGIPFAEPPVGKLRFQEPVPAQAWSGILNASSYSDACIQYSHGTYNKETPVNGSEDCLYLNVYTPKLPVLSSTKDLIDALVYIHGGAFMYGSGIAYSPEYLLDEDIVLVTINYRLGALGFLSTEDSVLPGNNGMKDQVLALKWVKNNIAAFGGNPNSVTIAGMSAGGASVHFHILSPLSKGLFQRAISLSGSALAPWPIMENAKEKAHRVADYLGCPTEKSSALVECLQEKPANRVVESARLFMPWMYSPFSPFAITIEPKSPTAFLTELPIYIIIRKEANDVPWLNTFDRDEGLYPGAEIISDPKRTEEMDKNWNTLLPHLLDFNYTIPQEQLGEISERIRQFYLGNNSVKDDWKNFIKMQSDRFFFLSIAQGAKLHATFYKSPVYAFMFAYYGSGSISEMFMPRDTIYNGVCHGDDLSYVLKTSYMPIDDNEEDLKVSKRVIDIWATFIKGKPMPKFWPQINDTLPNFSYYKMSSANPGDDEIIEEDDFGNEEFWTSLPFNENIIRQPDRKDEL